MHQPPLALPMRLASTGFLGLLAALLVAGCAAPPEGKADPLFGLCPSWVPGGAPLHARLDVPTGSTSELKLEAPSASSGFPLDLVIVRVANLSLPATVVARAWDDEGGSRSATSQVLLRSFRQDPPGFVPLLPFASAADTQREFEILLSPLLGSTPGAGPRPLWLTFTNEGTAAASLDVTVTFHYRVCGA